MKKKASRLAVLRLIFYPFFFMGLFFYFLFIPKLLVMEEMKVHAAGANPLAYLARKVNRVIPCSHCAPTPECEVAAESIGGFPTSCLFKCPEGMYLLQTTNMGDGVDTEDICAKNLVCSFGGFLHPRAHFLGWAALYPTPGGQTFYNLYFCASDTLAQIMSMAR